MIRKYLNKIEKSLRIERCYNCGRCIWWQKGKLRYIESPKDKDGFLAPACRCCRKYVEKTSLPKYEN